MKVFPSIDIPQTTIASPILDARRWTMSNVLMLRSELAHEDIVRNRVTDGIARFRIVFFVGLFVLLAASFNGKWRLGQDSAIYRGLGHSLATGQGYQFGEWAPNHIFPGLPLVLAAWERVAGEGSFFPILSILLCAAGTLVVTYRLIRLHYPDWIAVCVTCGVGTNALFLKYSNEILTDIPFLFGVVLSLYGLDRLRLAAPGKPRWKATAHLIPGMLLAASMRPTFWVVAAAWVAVCTVGLIKGKRAHYGIGLLVLLAVCLTFAVVDPRVKGLNPFKGGYEREALALLGKVKESVRQQFPELINEHLPEAVFGQQLHLPARVFGTAKTIPAIMLSVIVLGGAALVFVRHPLWGLLIFLTIGVTVLVNTVPRYYLMVLPLLLLGLLLLMSAGARRMGRAKGEALILFGLAMVTVNNLAGSVGFLEEQRSSRFIETYRKGQFVAVIDLANLLKANLKVGERAIAPGGSLLSYLSGRHVYTQRELVEGAAEPDYPRHIRDLQIEYAVFDSRWYPDDKAVWGMMERGILKPMRRIGEIDARHDGVTEKMFLSRLRVLVPTGDWRSFDARRGGMLVPDDEPPPPPRRKPTTRRRPSTTQATDSPP